MGKNPLLRAQKNHFEGILLSQNVIGIGISVVSIIIVGSLPVPPHLGDVVITVIIIIFIIIAIIIIVIIIIVCENKKNKISFQCMKTVILHVL